MYKVMGTKSDRTAYKAIRTAAENRHILHKAQKIEIELEFEFYRNVFYEIKYIYGQLSYRHRRFSQKMHQ